MVLGVDLADMTQKKNWEEWDPSVSSRSVEHAGRTVKVQLKRAAVDIRSSVFRSKVMVVIHVSAPQGDFSFALPPDKAQKLADIIGCAVDEQFVKKIMNS